MSVFNNDTTNETMSSLHEVTIWDKGRLEALYSETRNEEYPLHKALAEFSIQSVYGENDFQLLEWRIESLLNNNPGATRIFDDKGMLPIHVACKKGASLSIIHALVQKYPDSLKIPTRKNQKMLPLHLLCRFYSGLSRFEIMLFLIRAYPKAVEIRTPSGHLPLHLCLQNYFCTLPQIVLLIDNDRESVKKTNGYGDLPIHIACDQQYERTNNDDLSYKIIRYLSEQWSESLSCSNGKGELPMHTAIRSHKSISTIEYLLCLFPDAIEFRDDNGRTAMHIASTRPSTSEALVIFLYKMEPKASVIKDIYGKIPLNYVATNDFSADLIYTLIRSNPCMLSYM